MKKHLAKHEIDTAISPLAGEIAVYHSYDDEEIQLSHVKTVVDHYSNGQKTQGMPSGVESATVKSSAGKTRVKMISGAAL